MAKTNVRFATKATVVLGLVLGANAVPSVNVALKTSFGAPPYLVELLFVLFIHPYRLWLTLIHRETAAEENSTAYFPLLDRIADGYFDTAQTDEALYTSFRKLLQEGGHLSRAEDLSRER
jgi:UDP-glucose:glycoprotein glucosyltransferase